MIVGASGSVGFQFHVTQATLADTKARPASCHASGRLRRPCETWFAAAAEVFFQLFQRQPHIAHRLIATVGFFSEASDDNPLQIPWGIVAVGRNRIPVGRAGSP